MSKFYGATSLIGGGAGALDDIDGSQLADNDGALVITPSGDQYSYTLNATSGAAESSPGIISPDANASTKRWILKGARLANLQLPSGTQINEISIDGTFAGDSDDVVPTEKAVKTYADGLLGIQVSRGFIDGLIMSNDTDADHDIEITVGQCTDSTNTYAFTLSSTLTKRIDASWVVGDNNGGMFTGSVAVDTWYHMFLIRNDSDGSIDAGFDTSITAANKPAGYSNYRRLGSVLTDGSSNILPFFQAENYISWKEPAYDHSAAITIAAGATTVTLSTPPGIKTIALLGVLNNSLNSQIYVSDLDTDDLDPDDGAIGEACGFYSGNALASGDRAVRTNDASQVRIRVGHNNSAGIDIGTFGWIDPRGKE